MPLPLSGTGDRGLCSLHYPLAVSAVRRTQGARCLLLANVLSTRSRSRLRESRRAPGGARRRARTARRPIKVRLRGCGAVTLTVETHDKKRHLNNGVEPERGAFSRPKLRERPRSTRSCGLVPADRSVSPGLRTARSVQRANRWRQGRKAKRRGGMGARMCARL